MLNLWQMSLVGSVLIGCVLLVRALAGRVLLRRGLVLLWEIAALRLLVPFTLLWPFPEKVTPRAPVALRPAPPMPTLPVQPSGLPVSPGEIAPAATALPVPEAAATAGAAFPWGQVLVGVWAAVAVALALWFGLSYLRLYRRFAQSLPEQSPLAADWLARHPLRRPVQVRMSDQIASPLTYGVLRPVILLPKYMDRTDPALLDGVLTHEWVHIRRLDAVGKLAFAAALCLHWWNPLVWALYLLAGRDMELACDDAVVERLGPGKRAAYARTLLTMAENQRTYAVLCANLTQETLQERIVAIMKHKKTSKFALWVTAGLLGLALLVFLVGKNSPRTLRPLDADWSPEDGSRVWLDQAYDAARYLPGPELEKLLADTRVNRLPEWEAKQYDQSRESSQLEFHTGAADGERQTMALRIYQDVGGQDWVGYWYVSDGDPQGKVKCYRLVDPAWVDSQLRALSAPYDQSICDRIAASVQRTEDAVSFTLPEAIANPEQLKLLVYGRSYQDGMGMSLHFFEDEIWQPGKTYTVPYQTYYTELAMEVYYGDGEAVVDLASGVAEPKLPEDLAERSIVVDGILSSLNRTPSGFTFAVPPAMTQPDALWLHVSGILENGEGFNLRLPGEGQTWQAGVTYSFVQPEHCTEWALDLRYQELPAHVNLGLWEIDLHAEPISTALNDWRSALYEAENLYYGFVDTDKVLLENGEPVWFHVTDDRYRTVAELERALHLVATDRGLADLHMPVEGLREKYQDKDGKLYRRGGPEESQPMQPNAWNLQSPWEQTETGVTLLLEDPSGEAEPRMARFVVQNSLWLFDGWAD